MSERELSEQLVAKLVESLLSKLRERYPDASDAAILATAKLCARRLVLELDGRAE